MNLTELSKARLRELAGLKRKKERVDRGLVVVEGERLLRQLRDYGIKPLEQFVGPGREPVWRDVAAWGLKSGDFARICDSEHPAEIAALFAVPVERKVDFQVAFYLDGISDPGNLGSVFRVAAAFGIEAILLSPGCAELSSPKVIRSSLGSVYRIPFRIVPAEDVKALDASVVATAMGSGIPLNELRVNDQQRLVLILGSEARGVSPALSAVAGSCVRIPMQGGMESLNVAVAAGIIAYHIQREISHYRLTK